MFWGVLSATTTAPPALSGSEDKYIVPVGATGAWAGQDGKVAVDNASWTYYAPSEGWGAAVVDTTTILIYKSAAWVGGPVGGASNLTTQYRVMFVDSAGVATESSSIVTDVSGNLLVGATSPVDSEKLGVAGPIYANGVTGTAKITVNAADPNGTSEVYITSSGTGGSCRVNFGDSADDNVGRIAYSHATNNMEFYTSATSHMSIESSGTLLVNETSAVGGEIARFNGDVYIDDALTVGGGITGARRHNAESKTANYTMTVDDEDILCTTNSFTITALAAASMKTSNGTLHQTVSNDDANTGNTITIDGSGAETINGAASITLAPGQSVTLWSADGVNLHTL
jgi:hypothetical protein